MSRTKLTKNEKIELHSLIKTLSTDALIKLIQSKYKDRILTNSTLALIFEKIAEPSARGISKRISLRKLRSIHTDYRTANGCQWARTNSGYLGKKYKIKRERNDNNSVTHIKLTGFNNHPATQRGISKKIIKYYKGKECCVTGVCSTTGMEIDHKDATYSKSKYGKMSAQKYDDFQPMSKAVNDAKRHHCKKCLSKGNNARYDARQLGFTVADIHDPNSTEKCQGCFWHDPQEFRKTVSSNYTPPSVAV